MSIHINIFSSILLNIAKTSEEKAEKKKKEFIILLIVESSENHWLQLFFDAKPKCLCITNCTIYDLIIMSPKAYPKKIYAIFSILYYRKFPSVLSTAISSSLRTVRNCTMQMNVIYHREIEIEYAFFSWFIVYKMPKWE